MLDGGKSRVARTSATEPETATLWEEHPKRVSPSGSACFPLVVDCLGRGNAVHADSAVGLRVDLFNGTVKMHRIDSRNGWWKMKISGLNLIVEEPPPSGGAVHQPRYRPAEIVTLLEGLPLASSRARTVEAFWPTIKAALLAYEQTHPEKVAPIGRLD